MFRSSTKTWAAPMSDSPLKRRGNPLHEVTPKWILIAHEPYSCKNISPPPSSFLSLVFVWLRMFFVFFFDLDTHVHALWARYFLPGIIQQQQVAAVVTAEMKTALKGTLICHSSFFIGVETPGVAWFIFTDPVAFLRFVGGEAIWIYDRPNTRDFFFRGGKRKKCFCQ